MEQAGVQPNIWEGVGDQDDMAAIAKKFEEKYVSSSDVVMSTGTQTLHFVRILTLHSILGTVCGPQESSAVPGTLGHC